MGPVRVYLDYRSCQGHTRCHAFAPETFELDELGHAMQVGDGDVAPEHQHRVRLAAANCPEYAITISD